jgi:hypothetical protein
LKKELSKRLWFVSSPEHDAQEIIDIIDNTPTINLYTAYGEHIYMSDYPDEYKSCKGCKYYSYGCFNGHPCINCQRNFKLVDEIREQKNDLWKDGASK